MKPKANLRHFLALAGSSLLAISSAHAATVNWEGDTSATWATAGNWDTAPANSLLTDIANFNLATYGGNPVFAPTVGTATSINGITIGASNGAMTLTNTAALSIGNSGISIANGAGAFTISGSTTLGAAQSWTNNSGNLFTFGAVTAGGNTLTIGGSANTTASGIISGTNGALTKEGAGLLTLNAANSYTGATTVNGGEIRWGITNAIAAGALNINNGGTVNIQSFSDTVGTITIAQGGSITGTSGVLSTGSGGLVSNDGGTISGFSSGAGLRLGGGITYNSTGPGSTTLQIDRVFVPDLSPTFNIANGDAAIDFEITGTLSGGGNNIPRNLTKTGAGVMQFSGSEANTTSTNQMPLAIWDGTVIFNKSAEVNALPNGNITIGDGTGSSGSAILQYRTSSNQIANNTIAINSDGLFDLNGKSETTSGALTMNGGSLTTGVGTLSLGANTNTISGASTVTGNLTFTAASGSALNIGGTTSINGTTTFSGGNGGGINATGSTSIAGTLAFGSNTRTIAVTNASDTLAISASTTGSGAITKSGIGNLVLTGSNGYSGGTIVSAGTLQIGDGTTAGTMASTSALTMGNATFRVLAPASGGISQTVASLATTASTGSTIRITPGASGNTTLTITSNTLSTGAGSSVNFDYTAGTTVGGTVGNNYVVWSPTLTAGIIGGAYTVTDSGGTGFATRNGSNIVRLTDSGTAGLPDSVGSATGSYFVGSGYSTVSTTTPGSLVQALSGAVAASNVTVNTTGLASGANLALGTNLLTLGAGMVISGPNAYQITGSGSGGLRAATSGGTINLYNANTSTVTISAPIVNNSTSRLTVDGTGTTVLSGVNTYTGATVLNGGITRFSGTMAASPITINNGVAQLGTTTGLTSSNTVTFGAGSTGSLQLLGNSATIGALTSNATLGAPVITNNNGGGAVANATLTIDSASASTFGGVIQDGTGGGTLALAKSGAGTLTLSGSSTYTGGTVINAGVVSITADANLGDAGGGVTLNGGRLTISGVVLNTARNMTVTGTGSSMSVNKNQSFTSSGALTGSGSLTFVDPGGSGNTPIYKFTSSGNTFTGAMTMPVMDVRVSSLGDTAGNNIVFTAAGTFSLNDTGATAGLTFNNRAIELSNTSATVSNLNTTHAITIGSNLVATGAAAKVLTLSAAEGSAQNVFSGDITNGSGGGTVGIVKSGSGIWTLAGNNSYTGGTTLANSAGTLVFRNTAAKSGTVTFGTGTTLGLGVGGSGFFGATDVTNAFAGTMTGNLSGITVTTSTNVGVDTTAGNFTYTNSISGSPGKGLTKLGNNTLIVSGTNTYTGNNLVVGGTLQFANTASLYNSNTGNWTAGRLIARNGTTLAFNVGGTGEFTTGNVTTLLTNLAASTGINNGMNAGSNLGFDTTNATGTFTIANVIADTTGTAGGARGLTKLGTGTLELNNTNTYTGATTVSAGTLLINGSTSSTSLVTVNNGGTLGGTGTIGGSVTLNDGAFLSPGASIESLATGSNVWNGGSTFVFEFSTNGSTGAAGSQWDLLAINGTLSFGDASDTNRINFDLVTMADATNSGLLGTWNPNANALWAGFVTTTGGITNFAANLFNVDTSGFQNTLNGNFSIAQNGNNLDLVYTAVPEPRAALLGSLGLLMLLRRRRA